MMIKLIFATIVAGLGAVQAETATIMGSSTHATCTGKDGGLSDAACEAHCNVNIDLSSVTVAAWASGVVPTADKPYMWDGVQISDTTDPSVVAGNVGAVCDGDLTSCFATAINGCTGGNCDTATLTVHFANCAAGGNGVAGAHETCPDDTGTAANDCTYTAASATTGSECLAAVCTNGPCNVTNESDGTTCETTKECVAGVCTTPTCSDNIQNQSEEKVDCGGPNCEPCLECPSITGTFGDDGSSATGDVLADLAAVTTFLKCHKGASCYIAAYNTAADSSIAAQYKAGCTGGAGASATSTEDQCTAITDGFTTANTGYTLDTAKSMCPTTSCPTADIGSVGNSPEADWLDAGAFALALNGCKGINHVCYSNAWTHATDGTKYAGGCIDASSTSCSAQKASVQPSDSIGGTTWPATAFECGNCKTLQNGSCPSTEDSDYTAGYCATEVCSCDAGHTMTDGACVADTCPTTAPTSNPLPLVKYADTTGTTGNCVWTCVANAAKANDATSTDPKCTCSSGYTANSTSTACEADATTSPAAGLATFGAALAAAVVL